MKRSLEMEPHQSGGGRGGAFGAGLHMDGNDHFQREELIMAEEEGNE